MRWHYRDPALLWLFVPAYALHLVEELWAGPGLPAWIALLVGSRLPVPAFVAINAVAMILLIVGIRRATRTEDAGWIAVTVATIVALNAVLHLLGSIVTGTYSPGTVSGVVVYLPLGLLTLIRAAHQQDAAAFGRGVVAGLVIHAVVAALAFSATR
jgi:hypothetical protein